MTTVFLSGSRAISRMNEEIRLRIDNMIAKQFDIVIGDANGADKAMQSYVAALEYPQVKVYFVGDRPRNNVGKWLAEAIKAPANVTGRNLYQIKDKAMARAADFGFVLWDGKSSGSIANVLEMLRYGKKVVVYLSPEKRFYTVSSSDDAQRLINKCDPNSLSELDRKVKLTGMLMEIRQNRQKSLAF